MPLGANCHFQNGPTGGTPGSGAKACVDRFLADPTSLRERYLLNLSTLFEHLSFELGEQAHMSAEDRVSDAVWLWEIASRHMVNPGDNLLSRLGPRHGFT